MLGVAVSEWVSLLLRECDSLTACMESYRMLFAHCAAARQNEFVMVYAKASGYWRRSRAYFVQLGTTSRWSQDQSSNF